jgi:hypothetical protein
MKVIAAARQQFMGISLVSDIPNQFVMGCVKNIMDGDCQLNGTETGGKMASGFGYNLNNDLTDFIRKRRKIFSVKLL